MLRNSTFRTSNIRPINNYISKPANSLQTNGRTLLFKDDMINNFNRRFVKVSANDIKAGIFISMKGKTMQVVEANHVKKGRGAAHVNLEMKELFTGKKSSKRLRTSEDVEKLYIETVEYEFSRFEDDGDTLVFLDDDDEEIRTSADMVPENKRIYLEEGEMCKLRTIDEDSDGLKVLQVHLPDTVEREIVDFGITAANNKNKKAKLENGVYVMVPPFLEIGDSIIVRTSDDSYVERVE